MNMVFVTAINYDKLIYDRFANDKEIMNYDQARLVDGFHVRSTGFEPSHLSDVNDNIGYYLHLHGSPLFYTDLDTGIINKNTFTKYQSMKNEGNLLREHLILCKTALKPTRISSSSLLNSYWKFFKVALKQSEQIILLGYSGNDIHVNEEIVSVRNNKEIIIIEYSDQKMERREREKDWANKLNLADNYFNSHNLIG